MLFKQYKIVCDSSDRMEIVIWYRLTDRRNRMIFDHATAGSVYLLWKLCIVSVARSNELWNSRVYIFIFVQSKRICVYGLYEFEWVNELN